MAAPVLTLALAPASVHPGDSFTVAYTASDSDEGVQTHGTSAQGDGRTFDWQRTYHDALTALAPVATGVTFVASPTTAGLWTGVAPASGTVTVTGSVRDSQGNVTSASADLTVLAPAPPPAGKALLGMSAPTSLWAQRVSEVGTGLQARRIFLTSFDASLTLATTAAKGGLVPVISFKTGAYSWADVAAGKADALIKAAAVKLAAIPGGCLVAVHHEPDGDGTAADFTAMQLHALPLLASKTVRVGVIGNGFWFNSNAQGLSDGELDTWVGPSVRAVCSFVAADTYQLDAGNEDVGPKVRRLSAWAKRVNAKTPVAPVRGLGLGEFNSQSAAGITDGCKAIGEDPLFVFGCVWNTDLKTVTVLAGDRLAAFRAALASWPR